MKTWYVANMAGHQGLIIEEETGENIAVAYDKEDANIIAAAPEMLSALLECEVLVNDYPQVKRMVKEAIKKARGQA
jgi:hypothetical protein